MNDSLVFIFIPNLAAGGAERVAALLANNWCKELRVAIVTYFDDPHFYWLDPRVKVYCLGLKSRQNPFVRIKDILVAMVRFRRLARRMAPDFVLSFMNKYNAFCLAALFKSAIPVIVSERDSPIEVLPKTRIFARNFLYPQAAGVICQTFSGMEFITSATRIKQATAIANPTTRIIDPRERSPEKIILNVGRLVPKKGQDMLLRAFALAHLDSDWQLILCGDGPEKRTLESHAHELGIADRVCFAGLQKNLEPYFKQAACFAFSSLYEGFPNVLAEAMVAGIPAVSFDCPTGPSELIQDGVNGLLVPCGDVDALANALKKVCNESAFAQQLGKQAEKLADSLDPAMISKKYLDFCRLAAAQDVPS